MVALDGEVSNSTFADEFAQAFPDRYFEMFIAEQQLVAAATGLSVRGYRAFASTFAAFFTRAYDFIRMGAISGVDLRLAGSHAGVEIGADGPSQMALEDLAMMRAVHGSTVLYPSDGTSTAALVDAMAADVRDQLPAHHPRRLPGPVPGRRAVPHRRLQDRSARARTTRSRWSARASRCTRRCAAADILRGEGIAARVIDLYSVKPVDTATLVAAADGDRRPDRRRRGPPPRGRCSARPSPTRCSRAGQQNLHLTRLAVSGMPGSGTGDELLAWAGDRRRPHRRRRARPAGRLETRRWRREISSVTALCGWQAHRRVRNAGRR